MNLAKHTENLLHLANASQGRMGSGYDLKLVILTLCGQPIAGSVGKGQSERAGGGVKSCPCLALPDWVEVFFFLTLCIVKEMPLSTLGADILRPQAYPVSQEEEKVRELETFFKHIFVGLPFPWVLHLGSGVLRRVVKGSWPCPASQGASVS